VHAIDAALEFKMNFETHTPFKPVLRSPNTEAFIYFLVGFEAIPTHAFPAGLDERLSQTDSRLLQPAAGSCREPQ
jgi:hypothetical protein